MLSTSEPGSDTSGMLCRVVSCIRGEAGIPPGVLCQQGPRDAQEPGASSCLGWGNGVRDVEPQALPLAVHSESLSTHRLREGKNWRRLLLPGKNDILTPGAGRDQPEPQAPSSAVLNAE